MTFEQWTRDLGYALTANEMYRMRQTWEERQKEIDKATSIIKWLDEQVKSGADDYEGSDEVQEFLDDI